VEAMASGLPIACSNMGSMPDVLRDGGLYFNPENQEEIYTCLKQLITNKELREEIAKRSNEYAKDCSWKKCAHQTFNYLSCFAN
jgi:glycosyltransferase involved in cell wall biosynthesis